MKSLKESLLAGMDNTMQVGDDILKRIDKEFKIIQNLKEHDWKYYDNYVDFEQYVFDWKCPEFCNMYFPELESDTISISCDVYHIENDKNPYVFAFDIYFVNEHHEITNSMEFIDHLKFSKGKFKSEDDLIKHVTNSVRKTFTFKDRDKLVEIIKGLIE